MPVVDYGSEYHVPVLASRIAETLLTKPDGVYFDGTIGGGGHAHLILDYLSGRGFLLGADRDTEALEYASKRLAHFRNFRLFHATYDGIDHFLAASGQTRLDGALLDLGISSHQIDDDSRGFAFSGDTELDMRMDRDKQLTAAQILNTWPESDIADVLFHYGEEVKSRGMARDIIAYRQEKPFLKSDEFKSIIAKFYFGKARTKAWARNFQALRIAVNNELALLEQALDNTFRVLATGGIFAVIAYHSLEDRIVKRKYKYWQATCVCPPELPACRCDKQRVGRILKPFPAVPEADELDANSRSRSARLRFIQKL
jgi:16S rRNA (cytosine1402-N4)-methyltransferase